MSYLDDDSFFSSDMKVLLTTTNQLTKNDNKQLVLGLNVRHNTFVSNKGYHNFTLRDPCQSWLQPLFRWKKHWHSAGHTIVFLLYLEITLVLTENENHNNVTCTRNKSNFHFLMSIFFLCYRKYKMAYGDINFVTNTTTTYYKPPVSAFDLQVRCETGALIRSIVAISWHCSNGTMIGNDIAYTNAPHLHA